MTPEAKAREIMFRWWNVDRKKVYLFDAAVSDLRTALQAERDKVDVLKRAGGTLRRFADPKSGEAQDWDDALKEVGEMG